MVGGYHPNCDSEEAWQAVRVAATSAAPAVRWAALPTFRLTFDDPFSKPFGETCRSSVGFVVAQGCGGEQGGWGGSQLMNVTINSSFLQLTS